MQTHNITLKCINEIDWLTKFNDIHVELNSLGIQMAFVYETQYLFPTTFSHGGWEAARRASSPSDCTASGFQAPATCCPA